MLVGTRDMLDPAPDAADQHDPRPCGGVRPDRRQRARQDRTVAGAHRRRTRRCPLAKELFAAARARSMRSSQARIAAIEARLMAWHRRQRTEPAAWPRVPTIGPIGACLLAIKVTDPRAFRSRPDFAAWIGLTAEGSLHRGQAAARRHHPRRRRDCCAACWWPAPRPNPAGQERPHQALALANKTARIVWKLMVSGERYNPARAARGGRCAALREGCAARPPLATAKHRTSAAMPMTA